MPLLAEKSSPIASPELPSAAENLAEDKLSALESFLESLNLPDSLASLGESTLALAASFLAALGIDLDFDTPLKPAGTEQASFHFRRVPKEEAECAAAPAAAPEDLNAVFFKIPEGYHGALPETDEQKEVFNSFLNDLDCDALVDEARLRLSYMKDDVEIDMEEPETLAHDDNVYKMARDILKYREERGLC